MFRAIKLLCLILACAVSSPAADCSTCHPAEAKLHAASAHASALNAPAASLFVAKLPDHPLSEAPNGYSYEYAKYFGGVNVAVRRGTATLTAPLVWIFGSGRQGQTPVLSYNGHFLEHRVSYYGAAGYGITIGQESGVSANARKALGWQQSDAEALACFSCHSSVVNLDAKNRDLTNLTPGVTCIRCHSGAEEHAAGHGHAANPGKLDHVAQVQLCGECHRTKPASATADPIGNVRFQPLRLMMSMCFRKSAMACTTCHAAHRDAVRSQPDLYNEICKNCHANQTAHTTKLRSDDCLSCHMPKVSPSPGLTFTDHFIRASILKIN